MMELSAYSARFLAALLEESPEFEQHLTAGPEPGCFTIEFPAPSGSIFWVNTEEGDRITVGFDAHHCHFGGWAGSDEAQDIENAVAYIRGLIDGRYEVAIWSRDGRFAGSVTVERGEEPTFGRAEGGMVLELKRWSDGTGVGDRP